MALLSFKDIWIHALIAAVEEGEDKRIHLLCASVSSLRTYWIHALAIVASAG